MWCNIWLPFLWLLLLPRPPLRRVSLTLYPSHLIFPAACFFSYSLSFFFFSAISRYVGTNRKKEKGNAPFSVVNQIDWVKTKRFVKVIEISTFETFGYSTERPAAAATS